MIDTSGVNKSSPIQGVPDVDRSPDVQFFGPASEDSFWIKPDGASIIQVIKFNAANKGIEQFVFLADNLAASEDVSVSAGAYCVLFGQTVTLAAGDDVAVVSLR